MEWSQCGVGGEPYGRFGLRGPAASKSYGHPQLRGAASPKTNGEFLNNSTARTGVALLLEGFVVIISILIAFGLDAWWGERQLRHDLREDLVGVRQEIESNRAALDLEVLFQRTATTSIDDLLGRIDAAGGDSEITLPDTVASFAMVFPPTLEASMGAVSALISDGSLSRLGDRRLAALLGNLAARVEDVRETELGARRIAMEELVPLFWEAPGLSSAFGRSVEYQQRGLDSIPLATRPVRLPNPVGLKNRLLLRRAWVASALRGLEQLDAEFERAEELLREVEVGGV